VIQQHPASFGLVAPYIGSRYCCRKVGGETDLELWPRDGQATKAETGRLTSESAREVGCWESNVGGGNDLRPDCDCGTDSLPEVRVARLTLDDWWWGDETSDEMLGK